MFRRLSAFSLLPLIGILTPFLLLPIVARVGGPAGWTAIGVGQSVGVVGSVTTLWGWWIIGPARISQLKDPSDKHALYLESLQQRWLVLLLVTPLAIAVSSIIVGEGWAFTASLMAVATSASGLSPAWYSIGEGKPVQMVLFEDVPKALAMAIAAVLVLLYRQIWIYPALLFVSSALFPVIFGWWLSRSMFRSFLPAKSTFRGLRMQVVVAATNLLGTSFTATPVPMASILFGSQTASPFVSAEKIYRLGLFSVKALGNAVQSWVIEGGVKRRRRQYAAIYAHAVLGLAGFAVLAILGPAITGFLFGKEVASSYAECIAFGLAFLFCSLATPLSRNILVPAGRVRIPFVASVVGAIIGLPLMIGLGVSMGIAGIAFALAINQALIFLVQLVPAAKWLAGEAPLAVPGAAEGNSTV